MPSLVLHFRRKYLDRNSLNNARRQNGDNAPIPMSNTPYEQSVYILRFAIFEVDSPLKIICDRGRRITGDLGIPDESAKLRIGIILDLIEAAISRDR